MWVWFLDVKCHLVGMMVCLVEGKPNIGHVAMLLLLLLILFRCYQCLLWSSSLTENPIIKWQMQQLAVSITTFDMSSFTLTYSLTEMKIVCLSANSHAFFLIFQHKKLWCTALSFRITSIHRIGCSSDAITCMSLSLPLSLFPCLPLCEGMMLWYIRE